MFYLTTHSTHFIYGYMASDHSDSERGNPLPPHGLLFSIDSKGSFICTIPQTYNFKLMKFLFKVIKKKKKKTKKKKKNIQ